MFRQATCDCGHECDQWYPVTRAVLSFLPSLERILQGLAYAIICAICVRAMGYFFGFETWSDYFGLLGSIYELISEAISGSLQST